MTVIAIKLKGGNNPKAHGVKCINKKRAYNALQPFHRHYSSLQIFPDPSLNTHSQLHVLVFVFLFYNPLNPVKCCSYAQDEGSRVHRITLVNASG